MSGRGHGRLIGDSPNLGSGSRGRGRGRGVARVPNDSGRGSNILGRANNSPGIHPDDAGLGNKYEGSLAWHVRNHGQNWVPKGQRMNVVVLKSPYVLDDGLESKSTLHLPDNDGTNSRDFDTISDELEVCRMNLVEFLWTVHGYDEDEQRERSSGVRGRLRERASRRYPPVQNAYYAKINYFRPNVKPKFPSFPRGRNPFSLLPVKKEGIYPFDQYGRMLFSKKLLEKWLKDPKSSAELLEIQIRKLMQMNELNGRWDECFVVQSEYESYGTLALWRQDRDRGDSSPKREGSPKRDDPPTVEPDSGFNSLEPQSDPWGGRSDALAPNDYSWEDETGTGYVNLSTFATNEEAATYVLNQVCLRFGI